MPETPEELYERVKDALRGEPALSALVLLSARPGSRN
jgi:hypothetical protein